MKTSGLDEFAIFAHGPGASTLGMYMASKFSSSVTRLIMVNPASAGSEYSKAIKNVEREGRKRKNPEVYNGANSIMIGQDGKPTYEAQDDAERGGLQRAIGNLAFADPSRPEIGVSRHLNSIAGDPQVMNDSKWNLKQIFKYKAPRLPVMIMIGQLDFWTPVADVTKVTKFFTRSYVAKFPRSGQYPFRSDPYRFTKEMEKILGKAKLRSKGKKKD
jgi:pimeloyl-ACP methyl ester carboxylesterase